MKRRKRVLVCPLDWGLGHATRCIPIINELIIQDFEVIIASEGRPLALLKNEYPQLTSIEFKGYNVSYGTGNVLALKIALQVPKILLGIIRENKQLAEIIKAYKIDCVISDNRYGCYYNKVHTVFITHQLYIKSPIFQTRLNNIVMSYIQKYNECWVPDFEDDYDNLSGSLSHKFVLPPNTYFIGPLSRFKKVPAKPKVRDILLLLSGPEPQRSIFQGIVINQINQTKLKAMVVCGKPGEKIYNDHDNLEMIGFINANQLQNAILESEIVISRSGYSTIMDLATLGAKAFFVPTPGQTEQIYLAKKFKHLKMVNFETQKEFNLLKALESSKKYSGFFPIKTTNCLKERVQNLKNTIR